MAGVFATQDEINIRATGSPCSVPSDNLAKLMYYLHCCNSCLDYVLESRYTNYKQYYNTSDEDKAVIITLAIALSPTELVGKIFFPVEDDSPLLDNMTGQFYKIENAQKLFGGVVDNDAVIVIEGQRKTVTEIMVITKRWLESNYINPMKAIADSLNRPQYSTSNYRTYTPRTTNYNYNNNYNYSETPLLNDRNNYRNYNGNYNGNYDYYGRNSTSSSKSCCSVCGCCRILVICISVLFLLCALFLPWYNYIVYDFDTPDQIDASFVHAFYTFEYRKFNNYSNSDFSFWGLSTDSNDQNFHIVFCVAWLAIVIAIVFVIPAISGNRRFFTCVIILIPIGILIGCLISIIFIPKTTPGCSQILANLKENNICNSAVGSIDNFYWGPSFSYFFVLFAIILLILSCCMGLCCGKK